MIELASEQTEHYRRHGFLVRDSAGEYSKPAR